MEPVLIATLVVAALNLLGTFWGSIQSGHFKSSCCEGCVTMEVSAEMKEDK